MSTRALYTFVGEMFPAWNNPTTGKRHAAKRAHSWNVYKHHDGYPTGAADAIEDALEYAWQLPRYEADEFAAAFIAANKSHSIKRELELLREIEAQGEYNTRTQREELARQRSYQSMSGGGVRLMPQGKPLAVATKECSDIEWRYEISCPEAEVCGSAPSKVKAGHDLIVKVYKPSIAWREGETTTEELVFCGSLPSMKAWAQREEAKAAAAYKAAEAKRAKARG